MTALIWFVSSMSPHMFVKFTLPCKRFLTLTTFVCFFPRMSAHMFAMHSSLQKLSHIGYISMVSPQYECSYGNQEHLYLRRLYHNHSIGMVCLQHKFLYLSSYILFKVDYSQWLHWYSIFSVCNISLYIWFVSIMSPHMFVKLTLPCQSFLTLATFVWFLPSMSVHMFVKCTLPCKSFLTLATFVWVLPNMSALMVAKNTFI